MEEDTIVRSSCLTCGSVDLAAPDVTVYLIGGQEPTYGFQCPRCLARIRKSTTPEAVALLAGAGAQVIDLPPESLERRHGVPLTDDDLISLAQALASTDTLAPLADDARPPGSPEGR